MARRIGIFSRRRSDAEQRRRDLFCLSASATFQLFAAPLRENHFLVAQHLKDAL
jgi:hypothetical protein